MRRLHRRYFSETLLLGLVAGTLLAIPACTTRHSPVLVLPRPSGPYAVGTMNLYFIDANRPETFTSDPNDHREISARLWYPAEVPVDGKPVSFMENAREKAGVFGRFTSLPPSVFEELSLVESHSYRDAKILREQQRFPILVFSHAYWAGITQSTLLMEELASHGYVAVSIAHAYETPYFIGADGGIRAFDPQNEEFRLRAEERQNAQSIQQTISQTDNGEELEALFVSLWARRPKTLESIRIWVEDISFIIDELEGMNQNGGFFHGRLDTDLIGVLGHSFGGAVSGQACLTDERVKAGINMDGLQLGGFLEKNVSRPFMFMHHDNVGAKNRMPNRFFFERAENSAYLLVINGTRHLNFSDLSLPRYGEILQLPPEAMGPIDGERCLQILNDYSLAFFDKHLRRKDSGLLDGPSPEYPEVEISVRTRNPTD